MKGLGNMRESGEWWHQLLGDTFPSVESLCQGFNEFLHALTSSFTPLPASVSGRVEERSSPVPQEFLVTPRIAYNAVHCIKLKKSAGPDPVPNLVWKEYAFELSPVVSDLYSSLTVGYIPDILKESLVHPVPKCSPPKSITDDLRPITLTSQLAKVLEGFALDSLFQQIVNKLDHKQFSIAGESTVQALVYFLHTILESLDRGENYIHVIFADFSKGFDLVDHNVLMSELELLGVHICLRNWIGAFLTSKPQRIANNGFVSTPVFPHEGSHHCSSLYWRIDW